MNPTAARPAGARLVVFARSPRAGEVKTRLARAIGPRQARDVYVQLVKRTFQAVEESGLPTQVWVAGDPADEVLHELVAPGWPILPQPPGDLGDRMHRAFLDCCTGGPTLLVGTDCPEMTGRHLANAADALAGQAPLVIGPARDGGYWLIGLRTPAEVLFSDQNWSTATVLQQTLNRARRHDLDYALLETLRDVDTVEDLRWARARGLLD